MLFFVLVKQCMICHYPFTYEISSNCYLSVFRPQIYDNPTNCPPVLCSIFFAGKFRVRV